MTRRRQLLIASALALVLDGALPAQCGGNGGNARLRCDPQAIGTTVTYTLSGGAGAAFVLAASPGPGPVAIPPIGTVCLDLLAPTLLPIASGALPAQGTFSIPLVVPNDPNLLLVLLFAQAGVADPGHPSGTALSNALRIEFENQDSFDTLPSLSQPRALATGNRTGDGRVLVAGGGSGTVVAPVGTSTTELFDPVLRTFTAGPPMSTNRAFHTGTTLSDGRVLVTGGVASATGTVTAACEIFSPATNAWSPAAPMGTPRAAHNAVLLGNGKVLVAGGTTTFAAATLGPVLNAATDSGEVYDPAANAWTPVGNPMNSRRFGAAAVLLQNGQALIISGISGATSVFGQELPTFTANCSLYTPATNLFTAGTTIGSANSRAFHGATTLADGRVWVTGGVLTGLIPAVTNTTRILAGAAWSAGPNLPQAIALPSQVLLGSGRVHVSGGVNGNLVTQTFGAVADCARYDGTTLVSTNPMPAPQGNHVAVLLENGAVLLAGGADGSGSASAASHLYTGW